MGFIKLLNAIWHNSPDINVNTMADIKISIEVNNSTEGKQLAEFI
jgi:hypothetical protein